MSKFAEKIRRASRPGPQPLGFVTSQAAKDATMVLAGIAKHARQAADLVKKGADVVVVTDPAGDSVDGAVAGGWIARDEDAGVLRERGYDFVLFDPDKTASTAVLDEIVGYVIKLPADATDVELRAIEGFELDAVDVGEIPGTLTVRRQIDLRRISALTRKPLMATVPADIAVNALQALRDTNVTVVAAEGEDRVERLRKTIDALPPRTRRREEERPLPLVPRAAPGAEEEEDED